MSARTAESGTTCPGPSAACMGARILFRGQARHSPPVRCVGPCGRGLVTIARYVVDAIPGVDGPLGGHLCPQCDPWTPPSSSVVLRRDEGRMST